MTSADVRAIGRAADKTFWDGFEYGLCHPRAGALLIAACFLVSAVGLHMSRELARVTVP
ncbi:hypothetical protein [Luteipulveratus mongoliensis]|uniref:hypothetical protein n=1 Tax=Luteipulveratus mongoliensis TaxID=571913 RepID=UPI0012EEDB13|nr:hypothetical protein [Luteipulveratus mongoliensis]